VKDLTVSGVLDSSTCNASGRHPLLSCVDGRRVSHMRYLNEDLHRAGLLGTLAQETATDLLRSHNTFPSEHELASISRPVVVQGNSGGRSSDRLGANSRHWMAFGLGDLGQCHTRSGVELGCDLEEALGFIHGQIA